MQTSFIEDNTRHEGTGRDPQVIHDKSQKIGTLPTRQQRRQETSRWEGEGGGGGVCRRGPWSKAR